MKEYPRKMIIDKMFEAALKEKFSCVNLRSQLPTARRVKVACSSGCLELDCVAPLGHPTSLGSWESERPPEARTLACPPCVKRIAFGGADLPLDMFGL
jgi:hypothetical protein